MSENNPYAPPATVDRPPQIEEGSRYYTDGSLLMIRTGAILPNRCIKTNRPVEPGINGVRKRIGLSWCSPMWFLLILVNFLIMLIVVLCVSKRAKIEVAISSEYRTKKFIWRAIWLFLTGGGIALFVGGVTEDEFAGILWGLLLFLIGMLGFAFNLRYLAAKTHHEGLFSVKGCHPDFLAEIRKNQQPVTLVDRIFSNRI